MERCGGEPFLATDDVGHFHQVVVDYVGKVVGRQVVRAFVEYLVIEYGRVDGHFAAQQVVDLDIAARLDEETHHIRGSGFYEGLDLLGVHGEGVAHVHSCGGVILEVWSGRGVKGYVGLSGIKKHPDMFAVDVATRALLIGAVGSPLADTLVNLYTEPCE